MIPGLATNFTLNPNPLMPMPNDMIHQHLQQLQVIILAKDNDIRFLSNRIQLLEQELQKRQTAGGDSAPHDDSELRA